MNLVNTDMIVTVNGRQLQENIGYEITDNNISFLERDLVSGVDVIEVNGVEANFDDNPHEGTIILTPDQLHSPRPEFIGSGIEVTGLANSVSSTDAVDNLYVNNDTISLNSLDTSVEYFTTPQIQPGMPQPSLTDWRQQNNFAQIDPPLDRPRIHAIAAIGDSNQIALGNRLPWRYEEDLELFESKVQDKILIMGRLTFETLPRNLKMNSEIIVVSTTLEEHDYVVDTLEDAISMVEDWDENEAWICGGENIYREAIQKELIDHLHISHIPYDGPADRFFPNFTKYIYSVDAGTTIDSIKNSKPFVFKTYHMKAPVMNNIIGGSGIAINSNDLYVNNDLAHISTSGDITITTGTADSVGMFSNDTSTFTATNVQDALENLEERVMESSGVPNTMLVNPNTYNQMLDMDELDNSTRRAIDEATTGLNVISPPAMGTMWMNSDSGIIYAIGNDGRPVEIAANIGIETTIDEVA